MKTLATILAATLVLALSTSAHAGYTEDAEDYAGADNTAAIGDIGWDDSSYADAAVAGSANLKE